jgi:hypothetical protein
MTKASYKYVYGKTTADISVSEGIAPSTYFLPDESLPTLWTHSVDDMRYEVLIPKGTILSLSATVNGGSTPIFTICNTTENPVGVAQYHCFRPFDKGTSQGVGWIRRGYIKYPYIPAVLTPGTGSPAPADSWVAPGDYVMSDALGRFTKWVEWDASQANGYSPTKIVGQIIDVQKFGVTYDTQLMEYLKWPISNHEDDFDNLNALTEARPFLATADYTAMYETGIDASTGQGGVVDADHQVGIDDALDRFGAQGMITIALML